MLASYGRYVHQFNLQNRQIHEGWIFAETFTEWVEGGVRGDWSENPPAPLLQPLTLQLLPLYITAPISPVIPKGSFTTPKVLEANAPLRKEGSLVEAASQGEGRGVHHHTAPFLSAHALPLPPGRTGCAPRARYWEGGGLSWALQRKGGKSYYALRPLLPLLKQPSSPCFPFWQLGSLRTFERLELDPSARLHVVGPEDGLGEYIKALMLLGAFCIYRLKCFGRKSVTLRSRSIRHGIKVLSGPLDFW